MFFSIVNCSMSDEIDFIPPGEFPIYKGPPDDEWTCEEDEQGVRCWQLGDGAVLWIYAKEKEFWEKTLDLMKPRKRVIPTYCPLPDIYPDFPGHIDLWPNERAVIYQVVNDHGTLIRRGFLNVRYEDIE